LIETLLCLHNITLHAYLQNKVCEDLKVTTFNAIEAYQGMGAQLHSFSTLEIEESEWLVSPFGRCAR
jgi:hypothetical protein